MPLKLRTLSHRHRGSTLAAVCLALIASQTVHATTVTYTFEQFSGSGIPATPLTAISPDSGPASFEATFASNPQSDAFAAGSFQPNNLFSGICLTELINFTGNTLTISLNMAVDNVSLVFATNSINGSNSLFFFSPSGNTSAQSTGQSNFDGGILAFSSSTPFTIFSLNDGMGPAFAIDNLVMHVAGTNGVATPDTGSTVLLLLLASMCLLALCDRNSGQLSGKFRDTFAQVKQR